MIEINKIYCMDCLEGMKLIDDKSVDLVVTSPPYDSLRDYKGYSFDFENIAKELFRIIKEGGVIVWIVGDQTTDGSETGTSFRQALFFKKIGFNLHDTMIYEKSGYSFPEFNRYNQIFEYMFVFSRGKPKTFNPICDIRNRYFGSKVARLHGDRQPNGIVSSNSAYRNNPKKIVKEYGMRLNIWRYNVGRGHTTTDDFAYNHPAMFPEKLSKDHILSWSNEGDLVLDPFIGSGTTAKMAKLMNRKFIGFEINSDYVNIANKRLMQETMFSFDAKKDEGANLTIAELSFSERQSPSPN